MKTTEMLNAMVPHFILAIKRHATPSWRIPHGIFPHHNLMLVMDGEANLLCNDAEFTAVGGDIVYFKPGDLRRGDTNPDALVKCYTIDFQYACPVLENGRWVHVDAALPFPFHTHLQDRYLFRRLKELFEEFMRHWSSGHENRTFRCRADFMEILLLLSNYLEKDTVNYSAIHKVEKVINYIAANYTRKLTLDELANSIDISPSHLGHIFKETTGETPFEFIIKYRITRAKEFLEMGYSVTDTAGLVGFGDMFYFSKYFKKIEGISPTKYTGQ